MRRTSTTMQSKRWLAPFRQEAQRQDNSDFRSTRPTTNTIRRENSMGQDLTSSCSPAPFGLRRVLESIRYEPALLLITSISEQKYFIIRKARPPISNVT